MFPPAPPPDNFNKICPQIGWDVDTQTDLLEVGSIDRSINQSISSLYEAEAINISGIDDYIYIGFFYSVKICYLLPRDPIPWPWIFALPNKP